MTHRNSPPRLGDSASRSSIRLSIRADQGKAFVPYLRRNLRSAHALLSPPLRELSVALANDAVMSALHERFLKIEGPTDVLTFELDHDAAGRVTAGEVVVCVPEARRQAKSRGGDVRGEVLLYALHGMLHLCGFDDRTKSGYEAMHRAEDDILTRLGVGAVFRPAGDSGRRQVASSRRLAGGRDEPPPGGRKPRPTGVR